VKATARRATTAAAVLLVGVGAIQAWGAVEHVSTATAGAGHATVSRCDSTPANWTYSNWTTNAAGAVTGVTVSGLNAACNGGTAKLVLLDSTGAVVGRGASTATVSGGQFTLTITGVPSLDTVAKAAVLVAGA